MGLWYTQMFEFIKMKEVQIQGTIFSWNIFFSALIGYSCQLSEVASYSTFWDEGFAF